MLSYFFFFHVTYCSVTPDTNESVFAFSSMVQKFSSQGVYDKNINSGENFRLNIMEMFKNLSPSMRYF